MRKTGPRQLSFVFADSPSGDGKAERPDASEPRSFLLQKAKRKKTIGPDAGAADNESVARSGSERSQSGPGAVERSAQQGSARSGWSDGRGGRGESPGADRPSAPRLAGGKLPAGRSPPRLAAKARGRARGLGIPNVVDRVAQQATLQVMEPIFEPSFHASSHGFRPKRGAHTAIAEATGYLKDGYRTVVDWTWPNSLTDFIINACWPGSRNA